MLDLAAILRIDDLRKAGVTALKIEGRLKKADWVRRAVSLYRRAIAGEKGEHLLDEAAALGDYTGRAMTCGYLEGHRDNLTGTAGRSSLPSPFGRGAGGEGRRVSSVNGDRSLAEDLR